MAKRDLTYVSKRDMTLGGRKVSKGQLVRPMGGVNDRAIYGDNTHWTARWDGGAGELCGTDGCEAIFDCLGNRDRHRSLIHGPERDEREKARVRQALAAKEYEAQGMTIGGHEVVEERHGPGGMVPYIDPYK